MLLHGTCFLSLLSAILFGSFLAQISGAPLTYEQGQAGDLNVDAKFENLLLLIGIPANAGSILRNLLLTTALMEAEITDKISEAVVHKTEGADSGRQPYHVEIVRIEKEGDNASLSKHSGKFSDAKGAEKIELLPTIVKITENSAKILPEAPGNPKVAIDDSKKAIKKTRSLWRGYVQGLQEKKSGIRNSQVENLDPHNLPVKEDASKAARPGISLKKQLSKKEEEDLSEERNELGNRYQEQLVLLGGGIENCGPGRYRDKLGICQQDKNFN